MSAAARRPRNGDARLIPIQPVPSAVPDTGCAPSVSCNRLRAAVEHAIGHLNWKVLKTRYHRIMTDVLDVLRTVTITRDLRTTTQRF